MDSVPLCPLGRRCVWHSASSWANEARRGRTVSHSGALCRVRVLHASSGCHTGWRLTIVSSTSSIVQLRQALQSRLSSRTFSYQHWSSSGGTRTRSSTSCRQRCHTSSSELSFRCSSSSRLRASRPMWQGGSAVIRAAASTPRLDRSAACQRWRWMHWRIGSVVARMPTRICQYDTTVPGTSPSWA